MFSDTALDYRYYPAIKGCIGKEIQEDTLENIKEYRQKIGGLSEGDGWNRQAENSVQKLFGKAG